MTVMMLGSWETGLKMETASDRNWNYWIGIGNSRSKSILVTSGPRTPRLMELSCGSWTVLMSCDVCSADVAVEKERKGMTGRHI